MHKEASRTFSEFLKFERFCKNFTKKRVKEF